MPEPFRILFVCTGNICRSALAERLTRSELARRLGPAAAALQVTSAGVRAMVGSPIEHESAAVLAQLGGDAAGFAARQLDAAMIEQADLVLVATRKHRATTARLVPAAASRMFTIREFARLAAETDVHALPPGPTEERLRAAVRHAAALRGVVRKQQAGEDDVTDPYGRPPEAHREAGQTIAAALAPVLDLMVAAVDPTQTAAVRRPLRGQRQPSPPSLRRRGAKAPTWRERAVVPLLVFGPLLAVPALLAYEAITARSELAAAKQEVRRLRTAALTGKNRRARESLSAQQGHTDAAQETFSGPLWGIAARLPGIGDDVVAVRAAAGTVDDVADDVLPLLLDVADAVDPAQLRVKGNQISVQPLLDAAPALRAANTAAVRAQNTIAAVDTRALTAPVHSEVSDLQAQVAELVGVTAKASAAADILPPLLGAHGKKTYFLAFQNNAEARGTGGLLGAYGILEANRGRVRILRLGSNQELDNPPRMPVNLGKDFARVYGDDPRLWINANVSPHFPYAARIWLALWQRQHGKRLDGVIATDPVAMGFVLGATGPARLPDGARITSDNAVQLTMHDVYRRYPSVDDNAARDRYLQQIAGAVFARVLGGHGDPRALVRALAKATNERRLLVYSADPAVQARLAPFAMAGVVPNDMRPYVGVTVNSAVPSKLDYYLARSVDYVSTTCTRKVRRSRVTLTFTNTAPSRGLPPYVAFPPDQRPRALRGTPRGTNYLFVDVTATSGSGLDRVIVDGKRGKVLAGRERGHPVFRYKLTVEPGQRRVLSFDLLEPRSEGELTILRQPLVRPVAVSQRRRPC